MSPDLKSLTQGTLTSFFFLNGKCGRNNKQLSSVSDWTCTFSKEETVNMCKHMGSNVFLDRNKEPGQYPGWQSYIRCGIFEQKPREMLLFLALSSNKAEELWAVAAPWWSCFLCADSKAVWAQKQIKKQKLKRKNMWVRFLSIQRDHYNYYKLHVYVYCRGGLRKCQHLSV